jgi:hypothetical protein
MRRERGAIFVPDGFDPTAAHRTVSARKEFWPAFVVLAAGVLSSRGGVLNASAGPDNQPMEASHLHLILAYLNEELRRTLGSAYTDAYGCVEHFNQCDHKQFRSIDEIVGKKWPF